MVCLVGVTSWHFATKLLIVIHSFVMDFIVLAFFYRTLYMSLMWRGFCQINYILILCFISLSNAVTNEPTRLLVSPVIALVFDWDSGSILGDYYRKLVPLLFTIVYISNQNIKKYKKIPLKKNVDLFQNHAHNKNKSKTINYKTHTHPYVKQPIK